MDRTAKVLQSLKTQNLKVTPVGTEIVLPNHSGAASHREIRRHYGGLFVKDNVVVTSVSSAGFTQVIVFDSTGSFNGLTPDVGESHVVINKPGKYFVSVSIIGENNAGTGHVLMVELRKNDGSVGFDNVHAHRTLAAGDDKGSISLSGIVDLLKDDTVELWVSSDSALARDVTLSDISLSLFLLD